MSQDRYERFQAKLSNSAAVERQRVLNEMRDQTKATLRDNRASRVADEKQKQSLAKARTARRLKALRRKADLSEAEEKELKRLEYAKLLEQEAQDNDD